MHRGVAGELLAMQLMRAFWKTNVFYWVEVARLFIWIAMCCGVLIDPVFLFVGHAVPPGAFSGRAGFVVDAG